MLVSSHVIWFAEIYAPSNSRRITYLSMQSVMVVVGAFGDRASAGNGAGT